MPPPPPPHREAEVQVVVKVDLGPQRATMSGNNRLYDRIVFISDPNANDFYFFSAVEDLDKIIGEMEKIEKKEEKKEEWAPSKRKHLVF